MYMRENQKDYWEFIRHLKNDPLSRENSVDSHIILASEHESYMNLYGDRYYICFEGDQPIGYVGYNSDNYISIAVVPNNRGKGVGKFMLSYIKGTAGPGRTKATVRVANEASVRLFEACGFIKKYYIFEGDEND